MRRDDAEANVTHNDSLMASKIASAPLYFLGYYTRLSRLETYADIH